MYFDTHCHLNFKAFEGRVEEVINEAKKSGVGNIIVPGTDVVTSQKAVEIAEKYDGIYAAVGIHPHHIFELLTLDARNSKLDKEAGSQKLENQASNFKLPNQASSLKHLASFLSHPKVVAVGEIGIDRHYYLKTKHKNYQINQEFIELQKKFFIEQIKLAHKYKKALIIHNREAKKDVLEILTNHQSLITNYSSVFHCCEPDLELLDFAKKNKMFIGVDGDITYQNPPAGGKQEFIKKVPIEMLVLETDSPFLMPRLLSMRRPSTRYNEPKNIPLIAGFIAQLLHCSVDELEKQMTENAKKLFNL